MDNVECNGDEQRLADCRHLDNHNCFHGEDAGVVCLRSNNHLYIEIDSS